MQDIVAESIAFPVDCRQMLNHSIGESANSYLSTLDNFTIGFIRIIDSHFQTRINNINAVSQAEIKSYGDKEKRQVRIQAQIKAFNPKLLADDIKSGIDSLLSLEAYKSNLSALLSDPFTAEITKRYILSEATYSKLMCGGIRSLKLLFSEMNKLVSANQELINTIEALNKQSGLKNGIAIAASFVGAFLGHATGIRRASGAGSRAARSLVGSLFGDDQKIDSALENYSLAFNNTHQVWLEIKNLLHDELLGVAYSIYGGTLVRIVNDLHAVGMTISTLDFKNNSFGSPCKFKVSLHGDAKNKYCSWAEINIKKIDEQIAKGQFNIAYSAAIKALAFCMQNKVRLQEMDEGLHSYALRFQKQLIYSVVNIADQLDPSEIRKRLLFWLQISKQIVFLPDEETHSMLLIPIVVATEAFNKKDQ